MMLHDMKEKLDPSQFGNQKGLGIQHYLIKIIHKILSTLDKNSKGQIFAVIASFIDWKQAFNRQDSTLGIKSCIKNGVRPALIPMLSNYFQGRKGFVKWKNVNSETKDIYGGGPQGGFIGLLEYLSQSNNNAEMIDKEEKFKFVDDLTALELVNLISIGMSNFNVKHSVPSDIPIHNGYIAPENLRTQEYLDAILDWTTKNKMKINTDKTKLMIFNYTQNHQFTTRVSMDNVIIEVVDQTKILGTHITNDLKWDINTQNIVRKSNARMQLLRKVASFGATLEDMKHIYKLFVRSSLEHSSSVWHTSLSKENKTDLERIQKSAFRLMLGNKYISYKNAQNVLQLETLKDRREVLFRRFAMNSLKVSQMSTIIKEKIQTHIMETRNKENYEIENANTDRLKNSAGVQIQYFLNRPS